MYSRLFCYQHLTLLLELGLGGLIIGHSFVSIIVLISADMLIHISPRFKRNENSKTWSKMAPMNEISSLFCRSTTRGARGVRRCWWSPEGFWISWKSKLFQIPTRKVSNFLFVWVLFKLQRRNWEFYFIAFFFSCSTRDFPIGKVLVQFPLKYKFLPSVFWK